VALCAALLGTSAAFTSCNSDPTSGGEDPPRTANDILTVTASGAASVAVLSNDQKLDNEPLTFAIDADPTVGRASFNADRTVRLELPEGFRGVTRFRYKVTNALGGFSTSTAVVFVDVPAYRVAFTARNASQNQEIYVSDLISSTQISQATTGNLRLQNAWRSPRGSVIVYDRADPAQVAVTTERFYVRTTPIASPVRIQQPLGRSFLGSAPVVMSEDGRYIAFATAPTSSGGQANNLYVLDTNGSGSAALVDLSANLLASLTQWSEGQPTLYFMSAPAGGGAAIYRAATGSLDSPERVSPIYAAADTHAQMSVSPDQTKIVLVGTHGNQNGAFLIDPANPSSERRLTTDMPAGALIESFYINEDFTELTYLWRIGNVANARVSVVPVASTGTPATVIEADIQSLSDLRLDGEAALITLGSGSGDGTLWEVSLDRSVPAQRVATNVSGGVYDDSGDQVYLFSGTVAPAVVHRASFGRDALALVRSNTPPLALYVAPSDARTAAIVEDPTSGLVLVNAAAPGSTLRLTDLQVGTLSSATLLPDVIVQ